MAKHTLITLAVFAFMAGAPPAWAANLEAEDAFAEAFSSIKDQTFTLTGREFSGHFTARWVELGGVKSKDTVVIQERPSGTRGSRIDVEFRFRSIYSGFFSPNRSRLKESATAAADRAFAVVNELEITRMLFKDPDLGQEEF